MMSLVSLLAAFVYFFFERTLPNASQLVTGHEREEETARAAEQDGIDEGKRPSRVAQQWTYVRMSLTSLPGAFWLLCITQLLQCEFQDFSRRATVHPDQNYLVDTAGAALTYLSNVADVSQLLFFLSGAKGLANALSFCPTDGTSHSRGFQTRRWIYSQFFQSRFPFLEAR